ncbi:ATP-binding protein [Microbacterium sp. SSW1-59]|uniref:ATP-binding protein n=1 Tax=Microbacterium xanthum TaxID=3079794 RepID=UPI002AD29C5D|nr:ATP-binding protein [Microbacterium sp. SSW1-59]MDZ8200887.1 ATP-binding protein [Microbacterium sp. SSW1-59]
MSGDVRLEARGAAEETFVDTVHDLLDVLFERGSVGDDDQMLFRLAVSEVATNIVEHAQSREPIEIDFALTCDAEQLWAVFTDNADPALIDLENVGMPDADAESGRGLAIALAALDELTRRTEDGNTWILRRRRQPAA